VHYGIPKRINYDLLESKVIKELCQLTGMKKSRTTSYHPMGNGMCESFKRTIFNMLGSLKLCWYPPLDFSNVRKSMQASSYDEEVDMCTSGAL
jgi:transposase InsO family protein